MAAQELDKPNKLWDEFKTAYNNPQEAEAFVKEVKKLMKFFMEDIREFNQYKQEEAYQTFIYDYTKLVKKLDQYFEPADPEVVIDLIDNKMCSLLHAPDPDEQAVNIGNQKRTY